MHSAQRTPPGDLTGTPVVPGIAYAPAAWAQQRRHVARDTRVIDETDRESEKTRFLTAANTVADRFTRRASTASGVASEVLTATAALTKDRGWLRADRN